MRPNETEAKNGCLILDRASMRINLNAVYSVSIGIEFHISGSDKAEDRRERKSP